MTLLSQAEALDRPTTVCLPQARSRYWPHTFLDITYESLAKAFNQPLAHHKETLHRMMEMSKHRPWVANQTEEQKVARERMALFPERAEVLYIANDMWVVRTSACARGRSPVL
jgi:hypothetical protein